MADSTNNLPQVVAGAGAAQRVNDLLAAASPAMLYAMNPTTTTGLTWGYLGGRYQSTAISNGTVSLTASQTNYIVAARSNGAVSVSTSTTNWNNTADYMRLYLVVAGSSSITSYEDHRSASGGGGASAFTDLTDTPSSYSGQAGNTPVVNGTEDGLEFTAPGSYTFTTVQDEAGTTYTLLPADAGKWLVLTNASAKDIEINTDATTAQPANGEWVFENEGTGDATIVPAVGVTVTPPAGGTLVIPQGGVVILKRKAADEFKLAGQTVAA
jgi:hypothetical protein